MKDENTYSYDVFISYRWVTPDQEWVRDQLYPALIRADLKVCLDVEEFIPGRESLLEMERAGLQSRRVVCVVSPSYFEENRLVEFESLMARRRDPAGRNSVLIPLVIVETDIPERLRGLIPIFWLNPRDRDREWRKLLRVLDAPNLGCPPPYTVEQMQTEQCVEMHQQPDNQVPSGTRNVQEYDTYLSKILDVLTSMHQNLDMFLKVIEMKEQNEDSQVNIIEAWRTLFNLQPDSQSEHFENALKKAEKVRDAIEGGSSIVEDQHTLQAISQELEKASYYVDTQLRSYQREIVDKAVEATLRATSPQGNRRAGIVWQTQGSGLCLSTLAYISRTISQKQLSDFIVITVADRSDLTNELYNGFVNQVSMRASLATIVSENQQLTETLLSENKSIVFTTLQRLKSIGAGQTFTNKNILLIGYNLHSHIGGVRDILPNATFILFTSVAIGINSGEPEHFGRLISKYDFRQAIEEKVEVPVRYEFRNVIYDRDDLWSEFPELKLSSPIYDLHTQRRLAQDIVSHFEAQQGRIRGKALIIVPNIEIGNSLYREMIRLKPDWHSDIDAKGSIKVVSSINPAEQRLLLLNRFKDSNDPFQIAITARMWLEGVDIPLIHTVYLLTPLSKTSLLQMIARVNRVHNEKGYGLVVDYFRNDHILGSALQELDAWKPEGDF